MYAPPITQSAGALKRIYNVIGLVGLLTICFWEWILDKLYFSIEQQDWVGFFYYAWLLGGGKGGSAQ